MILKSTYFGTVLVVTSVKVVSVAGDLELGTELEGLIPKSDFKRDIKFSRSFWVFARAAGMTKVLFSMQCFKYRLQHFPFLP